MALSGCVFAVSQAGYVIYAGDDSAHDERASRYGNHDHGMQPVNLGPIPTPAMAHYALSLGKGSIMVTGSHIPFDFNGYNTYTARGELRKTHEAPISRYVRHVRERLYAQSSAESLFDELGFLKAGHQPLPIEQGEARAAYIDRYTEFFDGRTLRDKRVLVYQHSAVGRDLLVEILEHFGVEVVKAGRSDTFVPIDTENIDDSTLAVIQELVDRAVAAHGPLYAVLSTDGDSDRPLILGLDQESSRVHFFGGDLLGIVAAEFLRADAVVVPISCNDAVDHCELATIVEAKTRIGSPFVIEGIEEALQRGRRRVCGREPNGGFLTGSNLELNGKILKALVTRDSILPILTVLIAATERKVTLVDRFAQLPKRFSRAGLVKRFPRTVASRIVAYFTPLGLISQDEELADIIGELETVFTRKMGFGTIADVNFRDGIRIRFCNGDVVHIRPSGNADELRIYAVADTQKRANEIVALGIAEPNGILRRTEGYGCGDSAC